jgi:hypothetical protein
MEFNFDNDENIKTTKPPSVKAINNKIINPNGEKYRCGTVLRGVARWHKTRSVYR